MTSIMLVGIISRHAVEGGVASGWRQLSVFHGQVASFAKLGTQGRTIVGMFGEFPLSTWPSGAERLEYAARRRSSKGQKRRLVAQASRATLGAQ